MAKSLIRRVRYFGTPVFSDLTPCKSIFIQTVLKTSENSLIETIFSGNYGSKRTFERKLNKILVTDSDIQLLKNSLTFYETGQNSQGKTEGVPETAQGTVCLKNTLEKYKKSST